MEKMSPHIGLSKHLCAYYSSSKNTDSNNPMVPNEIAEIHDKDRCGWQLYFHILKDLRNLWKNIGQHQDPNTNHGYDNNCWIDKRPSYLGKQIMFLLELESKDIEHLL